jgi:lysozyme
VASDVRRGVSDAGLAIIKRFEGFSAKAYPDPQSGDKPWTIGYGFTNLGGRPVDAGDVISREEADSRLPFVVQPYADWVLVNCRVPLSQGQLDALTSFTYNLGPTKVRASTAYRRLNNGDYWGCTEAMRWWISPGTRVERGLRLRREAEIKLFNT